MSLIEALIETQEFATLPPVAAKVLRLLEDENIDIRDIAKVIEADATLTLKLLRVANSPLYATRTEINSIHQAIITLGLNRLTNIVLGVSIFSKFLLSSQKIAHEMMQRFWWHASCTGMVSKALSVKLNRFYKENEFIGGLLHDIGKLAMIQYDARLYSKVIEKVQAGALDIDAEYDVYGVNHAQVGAEIARLWKLPNELTTIIAYHTTPSHANNYKELVAAVRAADLLCEIWDAGFHEGVRVLKLDEHDAWKVLTASLPELAELDLEVFTFELEQEFRRSTEFLNIIAQETP